MVSLGFSQVPKTPQVDSFQDYKAQLRKEVLKAPATERGVGAWDAEWAVISWDLMVIQWDLMGFDGI